MRLDLYHAECIRIADEQMALLDEAKQRIQSGAQLIYELIINDRHQFIAMFLRQPISLTPIYNMGKP